MKEKTILVYFEFKNKKINDEDIKEMESLIESSGGEVCAISEVRKNFIDSKYYIGKGKCLEIKDAAEKMDVTTLIFNVEHYIWCSFYFMPIYCILVCNNQ